MFSRVAYQRSRRYQRRQRAARENMKVATYGMAILRALLRRRSHLARQHLIWQAAASSMASRGEKRRGESGGWRAYQWRSRRGYGVLRMYQYSVSCLLLFSRVLFSAMFYIHVSVCSSNSSKRRRRRI